MYLKKVELIGFKSFPGKTVITFEPGITSIIGPNGCGKTNISDALRWVVGETSARSLRGNKMEDVIFNGTEVDKPLSMAEVSLTLNNEDKIIPIEYSEVTVTRRCYRSGEGEYFINKNPCRLRDIQELFMDTGIGTESYSVMEQGKVDLILSSKPGDRRFVLEEAAGIAKYNARKDAALRKLELTEQNLLRIDDIIAEVKREIISIKRQVTKAEKYKENYERLKKLEINLALKKYRRTMAEVETTGVEIGKLKDESAKLNSEMALEESREESLHLKVVDIEHALSSARDKFLASSEKVNTIEQRIATLRERVGNLKTGAEKASSGVNDIREKISEIGKRIEQDESEGRKLEGNISEAESSLKEKEKEFASFLSTIENKEKELEEYKNRLFEKVREITSLSNDIEKISVNISGMQKKNVLLLQLGLLEERDKSHQSFISGINAILKDIEKITGQDSPGLIAQLIKIETSLGVKSRKEEVVRLRQEIEKKEGLSPELRDMEEEKRRLEEVLLRKRESIDLLDKERHSIKEEVDMRASDFRNLKINLEEARGEKDRERMNLIGLREKKGGIELHLKTLKERLAEYSQSEARLKAETRETSSENENIQKEILDLESEKAGFENQKALFKEEMGKLEEERKRVAAIFREEEERLHRERAAINKKLEGLHRLEISVTQKEAELSNIKDRISSLYQADLDTMDGEDITDGMEFQKAIPTTVRRTSCWTETSQGRILSSPTLLADEVSCEEGVKTEIESLRQRLGEIGPVNLLALEENKELEDRFSLLKREREDILKARDELHEVITRINHTSRQQFSETLEKVREEFHKTFRLLFNGGKADLILQEGDILESGIEIVARPPGKNLSVISQLSGGEKALTAIALLFALFRIRPSPFCILDEIDAPLDDSSIGRFGSLLKEFLKTTQFIIITHSKVTISLSHIIYGITMEEAGISKIISVKFAPRQGAELKGSAAPTPSAL